MKFSKSLIARHVKVQRLLAMTTLRDFLIFGAFSALLIFGADLSYAEQTVSTSRFGKIRVYRPVDEPDRVAIVLSDDEGWRKSASSLAQAMRLKNTAVVGISLPEYLRNLGKDTEDCHYLAGEFERFSQVIQKQIGITAYKKPYMVGEGRGGQLAYAIVAQSPEVFSGAVSIDFSPLISLRHPMCPGIAAQTEKTARADVYRVIPSEALKVPWTVINDTEEGEVRALVQRTKLGEYHVLNSRQDREKRLVLVNAALRKIPPPIETIVTPARPKTIEDLPIVEVPSLQPESESFVLFLSGDGGWASIDRAVASHLVSHALPVVGFNSLKFFWLEKKPEEGAEALERVIQFYLHAWKKKDVVLLGYSFGADVLPFLASRLSVETLKKVRLISLLNPSHSTDFEVDLTDWLGVDTEEMTYPLLPELKKLISTPLQCVYAEEEDDTVCRDLKFLNGRAHETNIVEMEGSHHFDGQYEKLAEKILEAISKAPEQRLLSSSVAIPQTTLGITPAQ